MKPTTFDKLLSANDVGATGSHQSGILVPKGQKDLLAFLPYLDPSIINPDAWITCIDQAGHEWNLRYIYYNNKIHGTGTRNEYRITHLTRFLTNNNAEEGDFLRFRSLQSSNVYEISILRVSQSNKTEVAQLGVIRLTGWRRVH